MQRPWPSGTFRRFIVLVTLAFWLGGFTFYAGVVVPTGMEVLGSHLRQGFITQKVTVWLNVTGACAIPILVWNAMVIGRGSRDLFLWCLTASLIVMALVQVELFVLHPYLDRLLDTQHRQIIDDDRFDLLHHVYLISATVQWGAGLVYMWCVSHKGFARRMDS